MKIALVLYQLNDMGGIISHVENLAFGLRELGHMVSLHILHWQEKFKTLKYSDKDLIKRGWYQGAFCATHQSNGWNAVPGIHKLSYKGEDNLKRTKDKLSEYDVIVWEVPVPTKMKANKGNTDWIGLYDVCDKNVAIIHDGNVFNTPWICKIGHKIRGLGCVHECAYNMAQELGLPRALILNPQNLYGLEHLYDYSEKERGFLSLQTFKAWKHVDDVIRAIPHMSKDFRKIMAGGGIEQRYMASETKAKERYYCRRTDDPDLPLDIEANEMKIWDRALYYGMEYLGFINEFRRDMILRQVRTLIDPAWSLRYSKYGGHFNRTIVDAMKQGAIPVAINLGISNNLHGESFIFKPNKNYIMIPYNVSPKEYAGIVEYASNLSRDFAWKILENNYDLLDHFDRRKVAQDYVNLALGKKCGYFNSRKMGRLNPDLIKKSEKELEEFFGKK